MKIGFVGLGKLGFPVALVMGARHDVIGYDVSDEPTKWLCEKSYPHQEAGIQNYLDGSKLRISSNLHDVVEHADIIFVAVQTPHGAEYEGISRLPNTRSDFDYSYLKQAVADIADEVLDQCKLVTIAVISTVLPGTCERELLPLMNSWMGMVYNPYFIAMGTVIHDFLRPEFVLLGSDDADELRNMVSFYESMNIGPARTMDFKSAELTKVIYNTYIGMKIALANTVMEMCHKGGGNADDVMLAIRSADKRLTSDAYLMPGMGDGGGCHPRDNIALGWLSRELGLSYDLFTDMMYVREEQTDWLAALACDESLNTGLPVCILGQAFKANSNITTGSPAVLLRCLLEERGIQLGVYDPLVYPDQMVPTDPCVFFLATPHAEFYTMSLPPGSVLLDPWGNSPERPGVRTVRIGR